MYKIGDFLFARSACNALPAPGVVKKIINPQELEVDVWHPAKQQTAHILGTDFVAHYTSVKVFVVRALEKSNTERSRKFINLVEDFERTHPNIEIKNLIIFDKETTNQVGVYINHRLSSEEIQTLKQTEEERRRTPITCERSNEDDESDDDSEDNEFQFSRNVINNRTKLGDVLDEEDHSKFKLKIGETYVSLQTLKNTLHNINCEIWFKPGKSPAEAFENVLRPIIEKKYQCGYCDSSDFESPPSLLAHITKEHQEGAAATRLYCSKCNKLINCLDKSAAYHAEYHMKKRKDVSKEEFAKFKSDLKKAAKKVRRAVREEARGMT